MFSFLRKNKFRQYSTSLLVIILTAAACYLFSDYLGYRVVAMVLLVAVSLIAMFFDIWPVLLAALVSALIWNYFFIPPRFTFGVANTEDALMLLLYFVIASVNAVLNFKIRQVEKLHRDQAEKENLLRLYNTILNSLSHELRTPIATVIGATDTLQNNSARLDDESRTELLHEISVASFRLNQQVENLLNMSRLESGFVRVKKDWCDINELVYEVVKRVESNDVVQPIHIDINPDIPLFRVDKGMLEQVLYNLLNNATIHTPAETHIHISAHCHVDVLQLVIEDNGPGFPQGEREKVFDKFYRLNTAKPGGTGLGLSIARGFVEAHGGTILLEDVPSGGARFIVEIPAETSYLKNQHE